MKYEINSLFDGYLTKINQRCDRFNREMVVVIAKTENSFRTKIKIRDLENLSRIIPNVRFHIIDDPDLDKRKLRAQLKNNDIPTYSPIILTKQTPNIDYNTIQSNCELLYRSDQNILDNYTNNVNNVSKLKVLSSNVLSILTIMLWYFHEHQIKPFEGKTVLIVGDDNELGRPLSMALLNRRCNVIMCHNQTPVGKLKTLLEYSNVVILNQNKPRFFNGDYCDAMSIDSLVIDCGCSEGPNGTIVGDVDPTVIDNPSWSNIDFVTPYTNDGFLESILLYDNICTYYKA